MVLYLERFLVNLVFRVKLLWEVEMFRVRFLEIRNETGESNGMLIHSFSQTLSYIIPIRAGHLR